MQTPGIELRIQNLAKSYLQNSIIEDFNLDINAGEFVAVLGPSGCGKSTLLRLIAGLEIATSGTLQFSQSQASKSFVFQDANLLPWRNLRENLELVFELIQEPHTKDEKVRLIREVLNLVGLANDIEKYPHQLSGGMRMRAGVARALLTNPKLLLLDEPFSALDENTRFRLQEELRAIWQRQKMTVIFVTHSVSEAVFLSERAILLGSPYAKQNSQMPTQILLDQKINLPQFRDADLRSDPNYILLVKQITQSFSKGEVMRESMLETTRGKLE